MKIMYIKQTDLKDCGVSCLMALVRYYKGYVTREYLREITNTTKEGVSVYSLVEAGEKLGFEAKAIKTELKELQDKLPVIAHVIINKSYGHFVVITKITEKEITIMDPNGGFKKLSYNEWEKITTKVYLLYKPKNEILKQNKEKSFSKLIFSLLKEYKITLIILLIFSIIYTLCNILLSYQFQFFIPLISNNNKETIKLIFYLLILVIFLKELTNLFRNFLVNYVNHKLDKTLISEVYNHIIKLPYLYFKNRTKGDVITRIQDIFKIREVISKLFITVTLDLVLIVIILIFMFKISLKLSCITLIMTIFYLLIIISFNTLITKKIKILKEKETIVNNHLIETISSVNTIKGMQIESEVANKLDFKYSDFQNESFNLNKTYYQELFFKELIYGLGLLIIIFLGVGEVINDNLTLGRLLVFNSLLGYYINPIQDICNLQLLFKEGSISLIRIKELLNVECEKLNHNKQSINKHLKGNIKINNLNYSYNGINTILKCQKLEIKEKEHVLFYGESGGGKSTLMKLICKYFQDYEGDILIDNRNLNTYNLLDIREKITYMSQDEIIYTDTIYNNIVLKNNIPYEKYLEIIKLTGVDKIINRSILKDEMLLDNNGSFLSGGEKQRILLARCLAKNSDIYIFDEATSAIDFKNERKLLKNIFDYLKNKTVIVISHRFNNRDLYQRFVLIEKGVIYEY